MIRTSVSLFALVAAVASLPAAADPRGAAMPAPAASAAAPAMPASTQATKAKRYCIVESLTGSRVPQKVCHTQAEWRDRGVDVGGSK